MKRIVAMVAVAGLALSACGSGDDAESGATAEETAEETAAESSEETAEESSEETAEATDDAGSTDETTSDGSDESTEPSDDEDVAGDDDAGDDGAGDDDAGDDDGDSDGEPRLIRSLSDIPDACNEQMANFLREVEPIVSAIDWQSATFADFEAIADEFEAKSSEFEQQNVVVGCDDLEFVDDNEFELMIEFAQGEAPGTVGFLQFLDQINGATGGGSDDGDTSASGGFADCDEAIDFVRDLMDDYGSFIEVPAADLVKFSGLATVFVTCSPEQLEFFDSQEVNDFLG